MKTKILFVVAFLFSTQALAEKTKENFKLIHVEDLIKLRETDKNIKIYDANNEKTRKDKGVIMGAVLLNSSSEYEASVLPADKNTSIVFYCANTRCTASHDAAKRAGELGFTNTMVLNEGIEGWVKAKQPVTKI